MRRSALVASLLLLSAFSTLRAQDDATEDRAVGDTLGTYVVRPGDTLKGITGRFLGDETLWRENWRLNPNLRDPHLLIPGQELRIILDRKLPPRTVQVTEVARRVDQKPSPNPWTVADKGDLLQEEDGLRTGKRSSAEVLFDDETRLRLTEESLIFLRRIGSTLRGVPQETVEIVQGQADLEARSSGSTPRDIQIILGDTTAKPAPGPDGRAETRVRQAEESGASLMVYTGKSSVEAGGTEVQVPRGMGTTVPAGGGAPTRPERLLAAPRTAAPSEGSSWGYSNLLFRWSSVRGAASYVLEICRDAACAALVDREVGLTGTEWTSRALPIGTLYWRVTGVAPSGLDGYPSAVRSFSVSSNRTDDGPPVVAAFVVGNPAFGDDEAALVADAATVRIEARDDASGVASVEYRWNGGDWRTWSGGPLEIPGEAGAHQLETRATDRIGTLSPTYSARIDRIAERPEAPRVYARPSVNSEPPARDVF